MIIFSWSSADNVGQLTRDTDWGPYSQQSSEKPNFSFEYNDITFSQGASHYFVDGNLMSAAQVNEVIEWANALPIDPKFKVLHDGAEHFSYLADTDYLFTVDKYAALSAEKQQELTALRQEARDAIAALEVTYGVV